MLRIPSAAIADWVTISSLATAGGTLVLAVATFGSVKSANRAARTGFWQDPIRDSDDPAFEPLRAALADKQPLIVNLLYGDHEGGQRTITRFGIREWPGSGGRRSEVLRYWNLDRDDPRER